MSRIGALNTEWMIERGGVEAFQELAITRSRLLYVIWMQSFLTFKVDHVPSFSMVLFCFLIEEEGKFLAKRAENLDVTEWRIGNSDELFDIGTSKYMFWYDIDQEICNIMLYDLNVSR